MKKNKATRYKKAVLNSAILWAISGAHGATINVDSNCSLVDAIISANTDLSSGSCTPGSGADVIQVLQADENITINAVFEASANSLGYVGLPIINSNVTIEGNGLTIRANNSVENFRLFEVNTGADLTLKDTTVSGANDGYGIGSGLLSYQGRVTLDNTTFTNNSGAVFLYGSFGNVINNSVFRHNRLVETSYAAGLQTILAEVEISHSSFTKNKHIMLGMVRGGGGGPLLAGGASLFQSQVTITDSTFSGNESFYSGAMIISDDNPVPLPSKLSRFSGSAMRGVINNNVTITNSTITGNTATFFGSGIINTADLGSLTLKGNIIAGNQELFGSYGPNLLHFGQSTVNLDGMNIIGEMGQSGVYGVSLGASDSSFLNAASENLYPLTLTNGQLVHPLKVGSQAIDGGAFDCFGSLTDQEGKSRVIDGDDNGTFVCDVGAFEHSQPITVDNAPCTFTDAIASANQDVSIGGCESGIGHDIIMMPENSVQTANTAIDFNGYGIGFPIIESGVTIEGNGSTFQRDVASIENFDVLLVNTGAQLNLIDSTISGANGQLRAATAWSYGNLKVINSTISNNQSGGVLDFASINSAVINSTIRNNHVPYGSMLQTFGSGLIVYNSIGFDLRNSTINQNSGQINGGVDFRFVNQSRVTNSTISGNIASYYGGMILIGSNTSINGSTFTNNLGSVVGGLVVGGPNPTNLSMNHSIVSGNELLPPPPPVSGQLPLNLDELNGGANPTEEISVSNGVLALNGFNIIGANGDEGSEGITIGPNDIIPAGDTSTVIETNLADNGGNTLTHLPVANGDAVDTGQQNCLLKEDQLGHIRPWDGNDDNIDACDIGAVEYNSIPTTDIIFKDGFDPLIIVRR